MRYVFGSAHIRTALLSIAPCRCRLLGTEMEGPSVKDVKGPWR